MGFEQRTDLDLAIVTRIVRDMNGQLRAESKFTFAFNYSIQTAARKMPFLEAASATPQTNQEELTYYVPISRHPTFGDDLMILFVAEAVPMAVK